MNMTMNAYESGGFVSLRSYFIRSDFLGGMCPDQTYNFATHGKASWLTLNLPSNTHPIDDAHKVSPGHAMNMTMNAYESVGWVEYSSHIGGMRTDEKYNFATHG